MSESADNIRKRMDEVRLEVGDDVAGIVRSAKALADWRGHVRKHPLLCLGAAAALGFLLVPKRKDKAASTDLSSADAQELIALLKKHGIKTASALPEAATASKGMFATLAGMAAPLVFRAAMNYGQHFVATLGQNRTPKAGRDERDDEQNSADEELARQVEIREKFNRPR